MSYTLRLLWPITDDNLPLRRLIEQAKPEVAELACRAHARVTGGGQWSIRRAVDVPGSGRVTEHVLVLEAPAEPHVPEWRRAQTAGPPRRPASDDEPDEAVVQRVLEGEWRMPTSRADRVEVMRRWDGPDKRLEALTGWNVARIRREERQKGAA